MWFCGRMVMMVRRAERLIQQSIKTIVKNLNTTLRAGTQVTIFVLPITHEVEAEASCNASLGQDGGEGCVPT